MFKLVICDDEGKTTIVPLIRDEISIGRKEGNTIRLTDRNVSRQHARLLRSDNEAFLITDLGSRNGTKVNGDAVVDGKSRKVVPGDQIYIGDYNLSIRTDVSAGVPMGRQMDSGNTAGIGKVTPHARLVMVAGPEAGTEYDLTVNLYVIGRSDEANLRIDDPSISRAHARLDGDEQAWTISDLDSINGIIVNGARRDDYLLKSGDVIELGIVKLRFVAPGEPFEYVPGEVSAASSAPPQKAKPNRLFLVLIVLAVVAVAAIVVAIAIGRAEGEKETAAGDAEPAPKSFEELVEAGKDQMQAEAWTEAARLFAQAQQLRPDDARARELKNTAIAEMEAQAALVAALAAEQTKSWREVVDNLAKIPRSSRYYDAEQASKASAALCVELVAKGAALIEKGDDLAGADKIIEEIGLIPGASDECRSDREALVTQLAKRRDPSHADETPGGGTPAGGGADGAKPGGKPGPGLKIPKAKLPANPYDNPYASDTPAKPKPPAAPPAATEKPAAAPPPAPPAAGGWVDEEAPPAKKGKSKMTWDTP
jgi:pSer/pThr/pTyr-binding forkhead associated (FHA) protein